MIAELERRTLDLWPPAGRTVHDGWVLATGGGHTRRTNSVQPLSPGRLPLDEKIDHACEHFVRRGLSPVFKLTGESVPAGLDDALAGRGFGRAGETCVMVLDLGKTGPPDPTDEGGPAVEIKSAFDADWLEACAVLNGVPTDRRTALREVLERLPRGSAFARIREGGRTLSLALGSVADGHVYLGEVATDPAARRRGLARRVVSGVLERARAHGARRAFLGVVADNAPARSLYEGLGFREAYRYWYREAPRSG